MLKLFEKKMTGYASIDQPQNNGYNFLKTHPIIPNMSVYSAIKLLNQFYKKNEAIDCLDLHVSYEQLFKDAITISLALKELGVRKGQIISVCMPNFYQAVATFLACNRIGAITTFLNYGASQEEIKEYLNLFDSPIFINYNKTQEENKDIKENTFVKHIITLDIDHLNYLNIDRDYHLTTDKYHIDFHSLASIAKFQKKGLALQKGEDDSLILFTSGSTGKPKSVVLTNKNILAAATYLKNSSQAKSLNGNRTLVCVPFTYPYGFATSTLMTLMTGKTAILAPNISKDTISHYLTKQPNIIFGSPALLDLIMKNIKDDQNLSSITTFISGGDFFTPSHQERGKQFFAAHGAKDVAMGNGSGNAETVSCGTNPVGIEIKPETVGKVLVGTRVMIIDPETKQEKKYGETGLITVGGAHVFKEYYNDPNSTNAAKFIKNGQEWFKTGTLGFINEDAYVTVNNRDSRFYIISTLNKVYCDRVQNLMSNFDCIDACAFVKVPDKDYLYVGKIYVVLKAGYNKSEETMRYISYLCSQSIKTYNGDVEKLKWYEIPTYIEFVDELPRRKGTDKIDYQVLEEDALNKLDENKVLAKKYN